MTVPVRIQPKRLWIENHGCGEVMRTGDGEISTTPPTSQGPCDVFEYVRADLLKAAEAERDRLREALDLFMAATSEESGWGTHQRMDGEELWRDIEAARAALTQGDG